MSNSIADQARANMIAELALPNPNPLSNVDLMVQVMAKPGQVIVPVTDASAGTHLYRYMLSLR